MSLSLLLTPNNLGPFFLSGTINTDFLIAIAVLSDDIDGSTIDGNFILGGTNAKNIILGGVRTTDIIFGQGQNNIHSTFAGSGSLTLINDGLSAPYTLTSSGVEQSATVNLTIAVNTGTAKTVVRKIGQWVDLFVNCSGSFPGVIPSAAITLAGVLPDGYRPVNAFTFMIMVSDTGETNTFVPGQCTVAITGDLSIRKLGAVLWTAGQTWGFTAFNISYPINT